MLLFGSYNQPSQQSCGRTGNELREPSMFPITASHDSCDEKNMPYDWGAISTGIMELDELDAYYSLGNSRSLYQNTSATV